MNDIEALAKRIILIGNGEILYDGNIKTLKVKYGSYKNIKIFTKDKIDNIKVIKESRNVSERETIDEIREFLNI